MFDDLEPDALPTADDAAVVGAVAGWARGEAAAEARRLASIAELVARRCAPDDEDPDEVDGRARWACDRWDAVAAEVGAALGISARRASSQMYLARSLRERLPKVNAAFMAGRIGARLVSTISWRTHLVIDDAAMAALDADIAEAAQAWGPLSDRRVETLIDALVDAHDPDARHWFEEAARGMDVEFGKPDDANGTRSMWGRLYSTHAELIERRLTAIARAVCDGDPRTVGQRRAEAMGAVFAGADRIACLCGRADCPNPTSDALKGSVVIHVVADHAAVEQAKTPATTEKRPTRRSAALMAGGGVVPTPLLAELIRGGAQVVGLAAPCEDGEPRYRPSVTLQRFVRCRDLTCRFPGCDAPAEVCDIDHAIAYPAGGTHPSNLRCLCRKHHLLRTFWVGEDGWSDKQFPDGTIIWTAPSGHTYTTHPGARMYFPDWDTTAAELSGVRRPTEPVDRVLRMPRRRRTREATRAQRIKNRRTRSDTS
ncbi:HNH endonuclease signature motif containing protein [Mycolicibacterium sp. P1-5]|uniref:HNH endonuclease signature motif containing protein n=1 Tax=Mycolicibacterium sp. P1-5 TaxID=2024617 RepID=UPI0011EF7998|nr:HNH endonuclease signature motif containing protein [Mycolicibacterium sp. P1-5]KAA0111957.1 HNH endonuclease [Mycolicibacterium sp. P1-5]